MNDRHEAVWRALSDPVRRTILDLLRAGPITTGALCAHFEQTRFGVMKHLKVLEAAGLVVPERKGRERWNYLNASTLTQATERWLTPFQRTWAERLGQLAAHVDRGASNMAIPDGLAIDIRQEVRLAAPPRRVFTALTREIDAWWQQPYRQAGSNSRLTLAPEIGAALQETGANGHAVIWGRIEEIREPDRLYLSGRFGMKGAVAGRVHFDLYAEGGDTVLRVAHTALGDIDEDTRASFATGWQDLLATRLRAHLGGSN